MCDPLNSKDYWDSRYGDDSAPDDWYCSYDELGPLVRWGLETDVGILDHGLLMLNVGCGRSDVSAQLSLGGNVKVIGVDLSFQAFSAHETGTAEPPAYVAADIMCLPFRDESFDIIFDKGTFDWILLSLLIAQDRDARLALLRAEMLRVLRPGGRLVVVTGLGGTDEDPATFLRCGAWSHVATRGIGDMAGNYRCHRLVRGTWSATWTRDG